MSTPEWIKRNEEVFFEKEKILSEKSFKYNDYFLEDVAQGVLKGKVRRLDYRSAHIEYTSHIGCTQTQYVHYDHLSPIKKTGRPKKERKYTAKERKTAAETVKKRYELLKKSVKTANERGIVVDFDGCTNVDVWKDINMHYQPPTPKKIVY